LSQRRRTPAELDEALGRCISGRSIDGQKIKKTYPSLPSATQQVQLGDDISGSQYPLHGDIGHVVLYDQALTATTIAEHY
jgi:hypothetical protein